MAKSLASIRLTGDRGNQLGASRKLPAFVFYLRAKRNFNIPNNECKLHGPENLPWFLDFVQLDLVNHWQPAGKWYNSKHKKYMNQSVCAMNSFNVITLFALHMT